MLHCRCGHRTGHHGIRRRGHLCSLLHSIARARVSHVTRLAGRCHQVSDASPSDTGALLTRVAILYDCVGHHGRLALLASQSVGVTTARLLHTFGRSLRALGLLNIHDSLCISRSLSVLCNGATATMFSFCRSIVRTSVVGLANVRMDLVGTSNLHLSLGIYYGTSLSTLMDKSNVHYRGRSSRRCRHLILRIGRNSKG